MPVDDPLHACALQGVRRQLRRSVSLRPAVSCAPPQCHANPSPGHVSACTAELNAADSVPPNPWPAALHARSLQRLPAPCCMRMAQSVAHAQHSTLFFIQLQPSTPACKSVLFLCMAQSEAHAQHTTPFVIQLQPSAPAFCSCLHERAVPVVADLRRFNEACCSCACRPALLADLFSQQ